MENWINPITLSGDHVILEPMSSDHVMALQQASADGELWRLWYTHIPEPDKTADYVNEALAAQQRREMLPFVVRHKASGQVIGSTRFCNIDNVHRRVEIGYTWYAKSFQRSAVNSECKLLLLQHAFEALEVIAVEFRTHWHNRASRAAIARLGAKQDGVLRNHQRSADGSYRDTVVFSITNGEWSAVKQNLRFQLAR
ncbi:GNAT family N-acetyltransferase [Porticoccus sp. W117]|uniref:GNAT family N-acetyltransferase n=1 Tax=Porticoccus sp. W117 TaxID=3054777 RepID=UPI002597803D|nr:GNAT family N-acetyltransferase [Porticoccus sp. W117]MDM3871463.1 GNAT family N-acetyltransferase [Porticoccus sp. W117]